MIFPEKVRYVGQFLFKNYWKIIKNLQDLSKSKKIWMQKNLSQYSIALGVFCKSDLSMNFFDDLFQNPCPVDVVLMLKRIVNFLPFA